MFIWESLFIWTKPRKTMQGYSRSRSDFLELLYAKYKNMIDLENYNGCLTLPEEFVDSRDFKAEEAIQLDTTIKLPDFYSLWKWIYKTSNQWALGSCTAMGTTHATQILNVRKGWVEPTDRNIITPSWKDLWGKMWHSTTQYDGWDYVEKAVSTALKEWIYIEENWELARFDWYATAEWDRTDKAIETMKRYLYKWCPIVWCVRWDKKMWIEMSNWEVKTVPTQCTGGHAICLVWWDNNWMWFINSWSPNDDKRLKSRFYISNRILKQLMLNFRYWILYIKEDAKKDTEYLKRVKIWVAILSSLKKVYDSESPAMKQAIIDFSNVYRKTYPEINEELPIK